MEKENNTKEYQVSLPNINVYPDKILLERLRQAYPNKLFRNKILRAVYDDIYDESLHNHFYDNDYFYPSDIPVKRLLDVHEKSGSPTIRNARHVPIPDFIEQYLNIYSDGSDPRKLGGVSEKTLITPDHKYYRAGYIPLLNSIFLDFALPPKELYQELVSEYSHPIIQRNLPSYFSVNNTSVYNRDEYDATEYGTKGTHEYYTHNPGLTEDYISKFLSPRDIMLHEAPSVNVANQFINYDYSQIKDPEDRAAVIKHTDEFLKGDWNLRELSTKLNLSDLAKILQIDVKENPPSKDFKEFWKKYHKLQPNDGIGGGGEW